MTLNKENIPIVFGEGFDTKTDMKSVKPTSLLALQNAYFQNPKSLRKRPGFSALSTETASLTNITSAVGLASYKSELDLFSGTNLYSYSSSKNQWGQPATSGYVPIDLKIQPVSQTAASQGYCDSAFVAHTGIATGDLIAYIWLIGTSLYYAVYDYYTGEGFYTTYENTPFLTGVQMAKIVPAVSDYVYLFVQTTASSNIKFYYSRLTGSANAPTLTSYGNIITDCNTAGPWDVQNVNSRARIVYNSSTATTIRAYYIDGSFVTNGPYTLTSSYAATKSITTWGDTTNWWVGFSDGTNVKVLAYTSPYSGAPTSVLAPTQISADAPINLTGAVIPGGTNSMLLYESISAGVCTIKQATLTTGGALTGPTAQMVSKRTFLAGRIYFNGTSSQNAYCMVSYFSQYQPTFHTMAFPTVNSGSLTVPVMSVAHTGGNNNGTLGVSGNTVAWLPNTNVIGTVYEQAINAQTQTLTTGAAALNQITGLQSFRANYSLTPQSITAGGSLYMQGGTLMQYDGSSVVEAGFLQYPEDITLAQTTGGSLTTTGIYSYVALYEWTDNNGLVHLSFPSAPQFITLTGSNQTVTVIVQTNPFTVKTNVRIVIYRTAASGSIYYRLTTLTTGSATTILNSLTAAVATTYTDVLADSSIIGNQQIYTTGGVLPNTQYPLVSSMCTYKDRMVIVPADNRAAIWFSQEIQPSAGAIPGTPVQFSAFLVQNVYCQSGGLVSIIQMDDKLVFFTATQILYMVGEGPSVNGGNSDYINPQVITTDVGCSSQTSVVLDGNGIYLDTQKGRVLCDRSLTTSYVGAPAEAFNAYSIVSAQNLPALNQIRFALSNGTLLVYDYFVQQWYNWLNYAVVDDAIYGGNYVFATANGTVYQETPTTFTDNGTNISLLMQSAWIKLADLGGSERAYRVQILGTFKSNHTLNIGIAFDYNSTYVQNVAIPVTSTNQYDFLVYLQRQKCEAIQIQIYDSAGSGESMSLSGMTLRIGVKKGLRKLPATSTYG